MRERREDEVGVEVRDQLAAVRVRERAAPEARAAEAAAPDRVQRLHELVAGVVRVLPRVEPDGHAVLDARHDLVEAPGAGDEERQPGEGEERLAGGDVQHPEEDPEVEEPAAQVVRLDEDQHGAAPDQEQRPEVLQPPLRQHLPLLAQVAGQEHDQQQLRHLAGLELERADAHPQPRAVYRLSDHGQRRQHEQHDRAQAEEVLVRLQPPVVAPQDEERGGEEADRDHHPHALAQRVVGVQAVDHGQAEPRQERRHRQQERVAGYRDREAGDHVRSEVEREEERRVRE